MGPEHIVKNYLIYNIGVSLVIKFKNNIITTFHIFKDQKSC